MVECVTKNQGIVYNFMGDGLIALFGVSSSSEHDHRLNAVNCAISMLEALKKFNQDFGKEIDHESEIGIGISTGEGLVWHIVTEKFLSYAITGDVLDNAIKLEGLTKDRKNIALISEPTYNAVKNDIQATELKLENTGENTEKLYLIVPEGPDK